MNKHPDTWLFNSSVSFNGKKSLITLPPDIVWTKDEGDIDIGKVRIVHGKGLRIENVRPSDEGTYICTAKNVVGAVSSSAVLKVLEPPVISVRPPVNLHRQAGQPVQVSML
jgi:Immunoglobulin I-set domain